VLAVTVCFLTFYMYVFLYQNNMIAYTVHFISFTTLVTPKIIYKPVLILSTVLENLPFSAATELSVMQAVYFSLRTL
jgi:hypothetical protein